MQHIHSCPLYWRPFLHPQPGDKHAVMTGTHYSKNSSWNRAELKESKIVPVYRKGDKTDCSKYRGISLLSTMYKILSNIQLSRLTPYTVEIIGDHQCGFRRKRSANNHAFCIRQILRNNGKTMKQCISYQ
jgi:hypothetical protein